MALWLGHIVMFSSHTVRALPRAADGGDMPRRHFLLVFLRTLIFAADRHQPAAQPARTVL